MRRTRKIQIPKKSAIGTTHDRMSGTIVFSKLARVLDAVRVELLREVLLDARRDEPLLPVDRLLVARP